MITTLISSLVAIILSVVLFIVWNKLRKYKLKSIKQQSPQKSDLHIVVHSPSGVNILDKNNIVEEYKNVSLIYKLEEAPNNELLDTQVVDTSLYLKERIISLTFFVQKQNIDRDAIMTALTQVAKDELNRVFPDEEIDEDTINNIVESLMGDDLDALNKDLFEPQIIPHCNLIHLKDGRWLWSEINGSPEETE